MTWYLQETGRHHFSYDTEEIKTNQSYTVKATDVPGYVTPSPVTFTTTGPKEITLTYYRKLDFINHIPQKIVYGNNRFLSLSSSRDANYEYYLYYSVDGINWTQSDFRSENIAFGNGVFVAIKQAELRSDGHFYHVPYYSTDCVTWTRSEYSICPNYGSWGKPDQGTLYFMNNKFHFLNFANFLTVSTDGNTWTDVINGYASVQTTQYADFNMYDNTTFVNLCYGNGTYLWRSSGGIRVSKNNFVTNILTVSPIKDRNGQPHAPYSLNFDGTYFYCGCLGQVYRSSNAIDWSLLFSTNYTDGSMEFKYNNIDIVKDKIFFSGGKWYSGSRTGVLYTPHCYSSIDRMTWNVPTELPKYFSCHGVCEFSAGYMYYGKYLTSAFPNKGCCILKYM